MPSRTDNAVPRPPADNRDREYADPPIIGITADLAVSETAERFEVNRAYIDAVRAAGGAPLILPCRAECVPRYLEVCDGFILTGGDDPIMEYWGVPTHARAKKIHPDRQAFELALLEALEGDDGPPTLGVCLGMQLMGLHAGGELDQYLPDNLATAADHWGRKPHAIDGPLGCGIVLSHHRQALVDAGRLTVVATAPDGVIEAIRDPQRQFYLGVQWHPERTEGATLGQQVIQELVRQAAARTGTRRI